MIAFLKNKKVQVLLAIISLLLLIDFVQESYAKYTSSANATGQFAIAIWSFKVNNQDVIANNDFSSTIVPVFDSNEFIAPGVIAPTSTGYFDIEIDSRDVMVSFDEEISLEIPNTSPVKDIIFTGYKLNDNAVVNFTSNTPTITVNHPLNEIKTINKYRFYIEWLDGENETMDNQADTNSTTIGQTIVNVNLRFIQKAS